MRYADSSDVYSPTPTSAITKVAEEVVAGAIVLICYDNEWVLWWAEEEPIELPEPEDRFGLDHAYQVARAFTEVSDRVHVSVDDRCQITSIGRSGAPNTQIMLGCSSDQPLREWASVRLGKEVVEREFE